MKSHNTVIESPDHEMENKYLNFLVNGAVYGIEIKYVLQIIGMQRITEMPEMPPFMKGFINLRGDVIPVLSMRLRFGKEEDAYTERTCIIVVHVGEKDIGLIVDAIQETLAIEPENISPPPSAGADSDCPYIIGAARITENRTALLVDVQSLFIQDSQ